jgi:hypothetical protein
MRVVRVAGCEISEDDEGSGSCEEDGEDSESCEISEGSGSCEESESCEISEGSGSFEGRNNKTMLTEDEVMQ